MYYVYVLYSKKDKKLYTGTTRNLKTRLDQHNKGKVRATKIRRPLKLVYFEGSPNIKDAYKRETYLKTSWGKRYLKSRLKQTLKTI